VFLIKERCIPTLPFRRRHFAGRSARATRSNSSLILALTIEQAKPRQSLSFRLKLPQWRVVFFTNILRAGLE
jgi:hypothetical protein